MACNISEIGHALPQAVGPKTLLALPAEILLQILRLSLPPTIDNPYDSEHGSRKRPSEDVWLLGEHGRSTTILRTCRVLYDMGKLVLYSENVLKLSIYGRCLVLNLPYAYTEEGSGKPCVGLRSPHITSLPGCMPPPSRQIEIEFFQSTVNKCTFCGRSARFPTSLVTFRYLCLRLKLVESLRSVTLNCCFVEAFRQKRNRQRNTKGRYGRLREILRKLTSSKQLLFKELSDLTKKLPDMGLVRGEEIKVVDLS